MEAASAARGRRSLTGLSIHVTFRKRGGFRIIVTVTDQQGHRDFEDAHGSRQLRSADPGSTSTVTACVLFRVRSRENLAAIATVVPVSVFASQALARAPFPRAPSRYRSSHVVLRDRRPSRLLGTTSG